MKSGITLAAALLLASGAGSGAQERLYEIGDTVRIGGGVGYTFINADEFVYDTSGNRISHLLWESRSPAVNAKVEADLSSGWSLRAGATFAFSGMSMMRDYDWVPPYLVSYDFDDWTHRSEHRDTRLAHYFSGDIAVGKNLSLGPAAAINLHGGVSYTNVKWDAYGGTYVYSETGYRANIGRFPDGPGISFQQRYPGVFLGASLAARRGAWTFSGQVRGGASIGASDTDHHWMTGTRFEDRYGVTPFATAAARVDYAVSDRTSLFLGGDFQQFFRVIGDTTEHRISTGDPYKTTINSAGMALRSITVSGGFRMAF